MNREAILRKLRIIIAHDLERPIPERLELRMSLFEDLQIDSMRLLQLLVYIEESFGVAIPDQGINTDTLTDVAALVRLIESLQAGVIYGY